MDFIKRSLNHIHKLKHKLIGVLIKDVCMYKCFGLNLNGINHIANQLHNT